MNFDYNYFVDDNGNHDPMRSRTLITGINIIHDVILFTGEHYVETTIASHDFEKRDVIIATFI